MHGRERLTEVVPGEQTTLGRIKMQESRVVAAADKLVRAMWDELH